MSAIGVLPVFPLNAVVFPGESLFLHIFEPRYRQLVKDLQEGQHSFGIPYVYNQKVKDFGVEATLKAIHKIYPGGEMDIEVLGSGSFGVDEIFSSEAKQYSFGRIYRTNSTEPGSHDMESITPLVMEYLALRKGEPVKLSSQSKSSFYEAAVLLNLHPDKKYELMTQDGPRAKSTWLKNELRILLQSRKMEIQLQKNFVFN